MEFIPSAGSSHTLADTRRAPMASAKQPSPLPAIIPDIPEALVDSEFLVVDSETQLLSWC
jgi:hypothetical protein